MQPKDKVSQLRSSIKAKKEAEARIKSAQGKMSPGMEDQYKQQLDDLQKQVEVLQAENEEFKAKAKGAHDDALRAHAELDNFRKRMTREKAGFAKYGSEKMLLEVLPALDSLEKALEHAEDTHDTQSLLEGVQLVLNQFHKALEKFGLVPINAFGKPFDPHYHEAMGQAETGDSPPGTVVQEFRRGYMLHDRVLRPSMVIVAKVPEGDKL